MKSSRPRQTSISNFKIGKKKKILRIRSRRGDEDDDEGAEGKVSYRICGQPDD